MAKKQILQNIKVKDLAYKGHAIAYHPEDKREIHILGAVPGDTLDIEIYKRVKDIYYADVLKVLESSKCRVEPKEGEVYKSTSPWQIFNFDCENKFKEDFVKLFFKEHADTALNSKIFFPQGFDTYNYRNKIEYGFFRDRETGKYSFSFFRRGSSRGKIPVHDSALNTKEINETGKLFLDLINSKPPEFGVLKYLILRYSFHEKNVVAHLIIQKDELSALGFTQEDFEKLMQDSKGLIKGIVLSYSTPETPGARVEKDFFKLGNTDIKEKVLNKTFFYSYDHFFQVYVPVFEHALQDIKDILKELTEKRGQVFDTLTDFFAGVGVFGIALSEFAKNVQAVEISPESKLYAEKNAKENGLTNFSFKEASTDNATEFLQNTDLLILDPPRAGVPKDTIKAILKHKPETIVYLSCNPKTQAMDYSWLKKDYRITHHRAYNLFPHTPHIEHLLILKRKNKNYSLK